MSGRTFTVKSHYNRSGMSKIDFALNEERILDISIHDAKIKENRAILKDLIKTTGFLGKQQVAFHGNDGQALLIVTTKLNYYGL